MSKRPFNIGDRVRRRGSTEQGTVFATPYTFHGRLKTAVTWDSEPKWVASIECAKLARVDAGPAGVAPEARPVSVGALQHPMRTAARRG